MKELVASSEWDSARVTVSITLDGRVHQVWFAVSGEEPGREEDFLLSLTLFPAMVGGARLELPGEVSPRLLSAVSEIQDVFRLWGAHYWRGKFQNLGHVQVDAGVRSKPIQRASGVACFFSGGVDSFYTLLKHRDEVTHIIFVHGFDIDLQDAELRAQASRMARAVAGEMGKSLIEVETNLRSFSDRAVGWGKYHGAALASVALLFQHRFRRVLIAASNTYAELYPWGSHPLLDPLWSTELTEIEHDGCEATRPEKVAYISEHQLPMRWLRVCHTNTNGAYNCGRCGKCLRARITLRTVGTLERCETLPHDLDPAEVAKMKMPNETSRFVIRQNLETLQRLGTEPELAQTLATVLDRASRADEGRTAHTEIRELREQLLQAREQLERTSAKLEASRRVAQRSRSRSKRLAERNRQLAARRYTPLDSLASRVLRIPWIGKLVRRKNTAD